ncbi:MAG TPA: NAD(P)H-binding protein [Gaiellaceae bacterium]|nr:NAD(P)H-binding protein [Gaiellaceae bacterium]
MILVTGGTGFIGPKVVHALRAESRHVRCLVRDPGKAGTLKAWGCDVVQGDVTDAASLQRAVAGCDAVVHLVSIIAGRRADFERVMAQGTRGLVAAAQAAAVRRFVLMSALGTSVETRELTPYYWAKWEMEQAVQGSGLEHVVFRPSFVFGGDGGVLPLFIRQVRWSPVTPVVGDGRRRLQPIWVDDVAAHFAKAIDLPEAANRTFELGGPEQLTWNELYERIARVLRKRRLRMNVPSRVVRVGAAVAERLPRPPITRDQLTMLEAGDNVCDMRPTLGTFGLGLLPLDEQIRRAS